MENGILKVMILMKDSIFNVVKIFLEGIFPKLKIFNLKSSSIACHTRSDLEIFTFITKFDFNRVNENFMIHLTWMIERLKFVEWLSKFAIRCNWVDKIVYPIFIEPITDFLTVEWELEEYSRLKK